MANPSDRWYSPRNPNVGPAIPDSSIVAEYPIVWVADQDANTVNYNLLQVAQDLPDGTYVVALIGTDPTNETTVKTAVFGTIEVLDGVLTTRPALTGTNSNGATSEATGSNAFDAQSVTCAWGLAVDVEARAGRCIVLGTIPAPAP